MNTLKTYSCNRGVLYLAIAIVSATLTSTICAGVVFAQSHPGATPASAKATPLAYTPDPISTTSQPLSGKLFFNDEKRALLDKSRKDGIQVVEGEVVQRTAIFNGFVKRSDGNTTYWVNAGKAETRYVIAQPSGVAATSAMVGDEPKFVLTGTNEGVGRAADDAKDINKAVASTKKPAPKKHINQPKSKMLVR